MNVCRAIFLGTLLSLSTPAFAGGDVIKLLAQESGLSERKVTMVLGARSAFGEYRFTYPRARAQLERTIGRDAVERLARGEKVVLSLERRQPAVAVSGPQR